MDAKTEKKVLFSLSIYIFLSILMAGALHLWPNQLERSSERTVNEIWRSKSITLVPLLSFCTVQQYVHCELHAITRINFLHLCTSVLKLFACELRGLVVQVLDLESEGRQFNPDQCPGNFCHFLTLNESDCISNCTRQKQANESCLHRAYI